MLLWIKFSVLWKAKKIQINTKQVQKPIWAHVRLPSPTTLIWLKSNFIPSSRGATLSILTFQFCMQGHVCHLPLLPFNTCHILFAPTLTLQTNFPSHLKRIYRWEKRKQAGTASLNNSIHSLHQNKPTFIPQSSSHSLASQTRLSSIVVSKWPFGMISIGQAVGWFWNMWGGQEPSDSALTR